MLALNVIFAALFGAGLFALVISLTWREKIVLSRAESLSGTGGPEGGPLGRLKQTLEVARLKVTPAEFLLVMGVLAVLGGVAAYALSGAPLAAVVGAVAGCALYWVRLTGRAENELEKYENELPQVMARLIAGAQIGGTFVGAAQHVAEFGPELCREDWYYIYSQINGQTSLEDAFEHISGKRNSMLLNTIFEVVLIQDMRGSQLKPTLEALRSSLRERVKVTKRARTSMQGPMRELMIVCAIPFLIMLMLRVINPAMTDFYGTLVGQVLLLGGWAVIAGAFLYGYRTFSGGLREELSFGGLRPDIRGELKSADAAAEPADTLGKSYYQS